MKLEIKHADDIVNSTLILYRLVLDTITYVKNDIDHHVDFKKYRHDEIIDVIDDEMYLLESKFNNICHLLSERRYYAISIITAICTKCNRDDDITHYLLDNNLFELDDIYTEEFNAQLSEMFPTNGIIRNVISILQYALPKAMTDFYHIMCSYKMMQSLNNEANDDDLVLAIPEVIEDANDDTIIKEKIEESIKRCIFNITYFDENHDECLIMGKNVYDILGEFYSAKFFYGMIRQSAYEFMSVDDIIGDI